MNALHFVLILTVGAAEVLGQSTVRVRNCCAGGSPVVDPEGARLEGAGYALVVYGAPASVPPDQMVPVGPPVIDAALQRGCFDQVLTLAGVAVPGQAVQLEVRVFEHRNGTITSWAQALEDCTVARGVSGVMAVTIPAGVPPPGPTQACLPGFTVAPASCGCALTVSADPAPGTVTVCWTCDGCHLERTATLDSAEWTVVTGESCVTVPATGTSQFFRVVCP